MRTSDAGRKDPSRAECPSIRQGIRAPIATLDDGEIVLLQTRLADPGDGARRVECADGPIWIVASEPV